MEYSGLYAEQFREPDIQIGYVIKQCDFNGFFAKLNHDFYVGIFIFIKYKE